MRPRSSPQVTCNTRVLRSSGKSKYPLLAGLQDTWVKSVTPRWRSAAFTRGSFMATAPAASDSGPLVMNCLPGSCVQDTSFLPVMSTTASYPNLPCVRCTVASRVSDCPGCQASTALLPGSLSPS